jgi:gliding motility-associated-like protein
MSNLLKLSTLIIFLNLFSLPLYACDNSTIAITNQTTNGNGSITYDLDLFVELGSLDATFYGFVLAFNSSTTTPVVDVSGTFPTTTTISNATLVSGFLSGTLQGLTGSNINSVVNDTDWNPFLNMTNVLSFESSELFGAASNDLTMQVQVTVMGCVEEIEFFASVNSGSSSCVKTVSTGLNCCTAPSLAVSDPAPICDPLTVDLTSGLVTAGSDPGTLTYWTDNSATNSLTNPSSVTSSSTYYIQLEASGCVSIQPVIVVVNSAPNLIVTNPSSVCSPSTVDLTNVSITAGSDPGTITYWTDPSATSSLSNPSIVNNGTFYIELEANGCNSIQPVNVTINSLPNLVITDPSALCSPATIDITVAAITVGSDPGTITYWTDPSSTNSLVNPSSVTTGVYYLQLDDGNCTSIEPVNVSVLANSSASFSAVICPGGSVVYNGTTYDSNNLTGIETLIAANGCDSTVTVTVSVQQSVSGSYGASICENDSLVYNGTVYNANNLTGSDTLISSGGCDSIVTVTIGLLLNSTATVNATICSGESFTYNGITYDANNLSGIDTMQTVNGCDSVVAINVTELPFLSSSLDSTICNGDSFEFNGTVYGAGNLTGSETLTSSSGCDSIVTVNVTEPPGFSSTLDTTIVGALTFEFNGSTYSQDNSTGTELFFSANGCDSIVNVNVVFENESIFFIPDGFSPNGDGYNDYLYVMGAGLQEVVFRVFNRWGELVFESDCCCQESCGWDGYRNGTLVNNGTFVYLFEAVDVNGEKVSSKGTISLIK